MGWFEHHRQEWIAETLRVFGFIQRGHLMRKFSISMPQASADLQRFMNDHDGRDGTGYMEYDKSLKRYVAKNFD